ncbi:MAG TPA: hypothetical protein VEQ60_21080 [Longimicrobium sp.]|nr:hypothetical protein [Longimicrobium sp.]
MKRVRTSINPAAFAGGVFGIVFLTKAASYLTPYKLYFSFSAFLYSSRDLYRWESLTLKLLIPAVIGFLLFYLPHRWMTLSRETDGGYRVVYRYLAAQSDVTARAAGFFSALLMAWPFITYWDVLMQPDLQRLRFPFLCIYFLYAVSYAYFAGVGINLARLAMRSRLPQTATRHVPQRLAWLEAVRTSFMGLLTSAIATYFASVLGASS